MKRIKIAVVANSLEVNGISTVIMNYYTNIDLSQFDITIIVGEPILETYKKKCADIGIRIIALPPRKTSSPQYFRALDKELKKNTYDILHVHGNSSTMCVELLIGLKNKIEKRIAHCHASSSTNMIRHKMLFPIFRRLYTTGMACSKRAGNWIFGETNFHIINNALDTETFRFSQEKRTYYQNKMQLAGKYIIGHVGVFNKDKNQEYVIKVFENIANTRENCVLLLIGRGIDYEKIQKMAKESVYSDRIILYGESYDVAGLMSCMDMFLLPSINEGFGIVALEAQLSGLPCYLSDEVPSSVAIGKNVHFLGIKGKNSVDKWTKEILWGIDCETVNRIDFLEENDDSIKHFDLKYNVSKLENIYKDIISEKVK